MSRIQFYPDERLSNALTTDATKLGVAVSTLVSDILKRHYGLVPDTTLSETELNSKVFGEVKNHINTLKPGDEFDLARASKTFANIQMVYAGKPSIVRAKIGKNFAKSIGVIPDFANVSVKRVDGKIIRNKNNAAIYEVKEIKEG